MASQTELNPILLNTDSIKLLTEAAAADAKHDFKDNFAVIFRKHTYKYQPKVTDKPKIGKNYKEIGTSIIPDIEDAPPGEHETLHSFLDENGQKIIHGDDKSRWLDSLFAADELDSAVFGLNESFYKKTNVNTTSISEYQLSIRNFDKLNAETFCKFLKEKLGLENDIYVQQDAGSISYNDMFTSEEKNPTGGDLFKFHYLNSREGQNDAAGKTTDDNPVINKTIGKKVKVEISPEIKLKKSDGKEVENKKVIYPYLPNETLNRSVSVANNFNSIYNIEISPIIVEGDGKKKTSRVVMYFRDKDNNLIGSTNKGKRENAKATLGAILESFFEKLLKKSKQDNASYFQSLQQKRGGDWLQCLATYDKQRFGLKEKDQVVLLTHDLICLAYALANGVHVLFSFSAGFGPRIMLFRNTKAITDKGLYDYLTEIDDLKVSIQNITSSVIDNLKLYAASRKNMESNLNKKLEDLERADSSFSRKLADLSISGTLHKEVRELVKMVLTEYFHYAYFTNMFPSEETFISPYFGVTFETVDGIEKVKVTPLKAFNDIYKTTIITTSRLEFNEEGTIFNYYKNILDYLKEAIKAPGTIPLMQTKIEQIKTKKPNLDTITKASDLLGGLESVEIGILRQIGTEYLPGRNKAQQEAVRLEIDGYLKELKEFVSELKTLDKRLLSYQSIIEGSGTLRGIDINKLSSLTKKIKCKEVENIGLFLENLNPIPVDVTVDEDGNIISSKRPVNRFGMITGMFKKQKVINEANEKSETDYSVFNYFIGDQLLEPRKGKLVELINKILTEIERYKSRIESGATGRDQTIAEKKKIKDLGANIILFNRFVNEVKFHLYDNIDWNYQQGTITDILKKLEKYFNIASVGGSGGGGASSSSSSSSGRGGYQMIGGAMTEEEVKQILSLLFNKYPALMTIEFNTEFLNTLFEKFSESQNEIISLLRIPETEFSPKRVEFSRVLKSLVKTNFSFIKSTKAEVESEITRKIAEAEAKMKERAEEQAKAEDKARANYEAAAKAHGEAVVIEENKSTTFENIKTRLRTFLNANLTVEEGTPTAFVEEIDDIVTSYIAEEAIIDTKIDEKKENFILSTPVSLYIDILEHYREKNGLTLTEEERTSLETIRSDQSPDNIEDIIGNIFYSMITTKLRAIAATQTTLGGGRPPGLNINDIEIPYLGWVTLYFFGLSLLQELENTKDATEGFDFPYLARMAQFFISMEQSMYSTINMEHKPTKGGRGINPQDKPQTVSTSGENENNNAALSPRVMPYKEIYPPYSKKQPNLNLKVMVESQEEQVSSTKTKPPFTKATGTSSITVPTVNKIQKYLAERLETKKQLIQTYVAGHECDMFLTNVLPRLDFMEGEAANNLKKEIFEALGVGSSYGWIAYFTGTQNDFFFGQSMDSTLNDKVNVNNPYLQKFIKNTLLKLKTFAKAAQTLESKEAIQDQIKFSLKSLLSFLSETEEKLINTAYQQVLIDRLNRKITQTTRKRNNTSKNQLKMNKEIKKIMSYTTENFTDLQFLMKHNLVKEYKTIKTKTNSQFKSKRYGTVPKSLSENQSKELIQRVKKTFMENPELKEKYIQRLEDLKRFKEEGKQENYSRLFNSVRQFYLNPERTNLLQGGTRKREDLRLKSRRRTHKKI